jgi:hypothetical protein
MVVITILNALFFSLSTGIFVSCLSRNERRASLGAGVVISAVSFLPIIFLYIAVMFDWFQVGNDLTPIGVALTPSPAFGLIYVLLPAAIPFFPGISPMTFWGSLAVVHGLSWLFLVMSIRIVPEVWKDRPESVWARWREGRPSVSESIEAGPRNGERVWDELWRRAQQALWNSAAVDRPVRNRLLDINPFLWLFSRDRLKTAYAWAFIGAVALIWMWGHDRFGDLMTDPYPLIPTVLLIHVTIKLWVASEVSHRIVEDRRTGAFELLLSAPVGGRDLLAGQVLALKRQFLFPLALLLFLEWWAFSERYSTGVVLAAFAMLVADVVVLTWLGIYFSLKARSINQVLWRCCLERDHDSASGDPLERVRGRDQFR